MTKKRKQSVRNRLIKTARGMRKMAYAKYSGFCVGAALLGEDGKIYTGCNVENISFGLTNCAERTAVFKAVSEGTRKFKAMAISSTGKTPTYPCGACRQVLAEFGNIKVYVDKDPKEYMLLDLFPHGFNNMQ